MSSGIGDLKVCTTRRRCISPVVGSKRAMVVPSAQMARYLPDFSMAHLLHFQ